MSSLNVFFLNYFSPKKVSFGLMLNVPVNNFSVMLGRSHRFLGITSTFWGLICLAQRHNTATRVALDPESEVLTPTPPRPLLKKVSIEPRCEFQGTSWNTFVKIIPLYNHTFIIVKRGFKGVCIFSYFCTITKIMGTR